MTNGLTRVSILWLEPGGKAKVPKTLTLRLDSEAGIWDLYLDLYIYEILWLADLDYVAGENNIIITLGSEFLYDFRKSTYNEKQPTF